MVDSKSEPAPAAVDTKPEQLPIAEEKPVTEVKPTAKPDEPKHDEAKNDKPATDGVKNTIATDVPKETPSALDNTTSPVGRTPPRSLEIDKSKPVDFEGEIATTNEIPSPETLRKLDDYLVLDRHGKSHTFKSLYAGSNTARRVLVIFVRHFFCGNCQEFLRSLSESITPDALLRLPISTFITVVGNGDPGLIDMYVRDTNCPYPVYTDPKHSLFDALGMTKTWNMGEKPAYMKKGLMHNIVTSVMQGLKQVPTGKALKSGDFRQVGGEFLFEPLDLVTPIHTPQLETMQQLDGMDHRDDEAKQRDDGEEVKRVTWCHRMKTTRDHAEIPELMEVLGLDGSGQPVKDLERWKRALETRKGTGLSMASEMSKLSLERSRPS